MKSKSSKTSEVQQKKLDTTVAKQPDKVSKLKAELE